MPSIQNLKRPAHGVDLIGATGATILGFTIFGIALSLIYQNITDRDNETVARQATTWANASKLYIAANYDQLLASAPTTVSRDTLINSGYLNSGESAQNLYQQTWNVAVRTSPKNNKVLDAVLLSSSGLDLDYPTLRYISSAINGSGGFVYNGSMPDGCTSSSATINGAACSWTLDLSGFGISTTSGHLAVNLGADILGTANAGNDFLHRFSTPGREEYNQMNTALDMNGMNLNRAGNLVIGSDGKTEDNHASTGSSGYLGWASTSNDGASRDATSLRAGMYFSTSAPSESDKENVWIKTTDNTSLEVKGKLLASTVKGNRLLQSDGFLMPGKIVTAGDACDAVSLGISDLLTNTEGLQARDSTGGILSCQSGAWKENKANTLISSATISNNSTFTCKTGLDGKVLVTVNFNWLVSYGVYWMDAFLYANGVLVGSDKTAAFEYDHGRASGTSVTVFHTQLAQPNEDIHFSVAATASYLVKISYSCVGV